jgi:hypothetical protein
VSLNFLYDPLRQIRGHFFRVFEKCFNASRALVIEFILSPRGHKKQERVAMTRVKIDWQIVAASDLDVKCERRGTKGELLCLKI